LVKSESDNKFGNGLILHEIDHSYGDHHVLRLLNLEVAQGEVFCLLGPSGCGKSTSLRIAAGLETIQSGSVRLAGKEVARPGYSVSPEQRRVGLMFQDYALFPHLKVIDNVAFGIRAGNRADKRSMAINLLRRLNLEERATNYPHMLSGGEQQRVALARALAPQPLVMLLDEPFSGLDRRLREQVRADTIEALRDFSITTLLVTHDSDEAMIMADRIALMNNGEIIQCGTPTELYTEPKSVFAASFFGDVNVFGGIAKEGIVVTPIGKLRAPFPDDSPLQVLVRHGDLKLESDDENASSLPDGTIVQVKFTGHRSTLDIKLDADGSLLTVWVENGKLWKVGKRVRIRLDPAYSFVFPAY